jgi:DNA helicase HerA-like ATPase
MPRPPDANTMIAPILVAKSETDLSLLPGLANRHGLVAGATGTGKTVTLQVLAEGFSKLGVPVFMADVKGDLTGISQPGTPKPKLTERIAALGLGDFTFAGFPVVLWDVFGAQGHPVRATIAEMGPLLLSRLLNLNDIQTGVLNLTFKIADDNGLLLLDLKDLQAILQHVGENAAEYKTTYGNISAASIGAIQRGLVALGQQGAEKFFGEPALDLMDFIQTDAKGMGQINILAADKLLAAPRLYATFLLWMLNELFQKLPEVGDPEKPTIVFFFDEAHLLFDDPPAALLEKIEHMVRLIRSKGVGVYFVTQNPLDVPDTVLSQLGNRVQHALRAFTPRDQKAVRAAAETFRQNPKIDVAVAITQLGVGEALVSFLDDKGTPGMVERARILPPHSQIGPITPEQRQQLIQGSVLFGHYEKVVDRESAYEILKGRTEAAQDAAAKTTAQKQDEFKAKQAEAARKQEEAEASHRKPSETEKLVKSVFFSTIRSFGTSLGRQLIRFIMGLIGGGSGKR